MSLVMPAVLPASKRDLEHALALFNAFPTLRMAQIDVVDGRFASPASWPYTDLARFERYAKSGELLPNAERIQYEIDLMCIDAEFNAGFWLSLGASRLTFHAESIPDLARFLASLRKHYGGDPDFSVDSFVTYGLALNIDTPLSFIEPYLSQISYVQFMGIKHIGKQGEPFDERVIDRIKHFREKYPHIPVQVDGGVSLETAKKLVPLGVTHLIVGSQIVHAKDPLAVFESIEALKSPYHV